MKSFKQFLKEDYKLKTDFDTKPSVLNTLWMRGGSVSKNKKISFYRPLYLGKSPYYIEKYGEPIEIIKLNPELKIFDLTKEDDYLNTVFDTLTVDKKTGKYHPHRLNAQLHKYFDLIDPYFGFNTHSFSRRLTNNKTIVPYLSIIKYFLTFADSHFTKVTDKSILDILQKERHEDSFSGVTSKLYKDFIVAYDDFCNRTKDGGPKLPSELPDEAAELLNAVISLLSRIAFIMRVKGAKTTPIANYIFNDKSLTKFSVSMDGETFTPENIANCIDVLQFYLFYIIATKFDGIYCPEYMIKQYTKEIQFADLKTIPKTPVIALFKDKKNDMVSHETIATFSLKNTKIIANYLALKGFKSTNHNDDYLNAFLKASDELISLSNGNDNDDKDDLILKGWDIFYQDYEKKNMPERLPYDAFIELKKNLIAKVPFPELCWK